MKRSFLTIVILTLTLHGLAQECKDIVYPVSGGSVLFDCCIEEVRYGNMVYFLKNGQRHIIEAKKIVKNGNTYELEPYEEMPEFEYRPDSVETTGKDEGYGKRQSYEYNYYKKKFEGAKTQRNIGIALTASGAVAGIASIIMLGDNKYSNDETALWWYLYGFVGVNVGIPLWISGAVRKNNNKKAMMQLEGDARKPVSLSLALNRNGLGLLLRL